MRAYNSQKTIYSVLNAALWLMMVSSFICLSFALNGCEEDDDFEDFVGVEPTPTPRPSPTPYPTWERKDLFFTVTGEPEDVTDYAIIEVIAYFNGGVLAQDVPISFTLTGDGNLAPIGDITSPLPNPYHTWIYDGYAGCVFVAVRKPVETSAFVTVKIPGEEPETIHFTVEAAETP